MQAKWVVILSCSSSVAWMCCPYQTVLSRMWKFQTSNFLNFQKTKHQTSKKIVNLLKFDCNKHFWTTHFEITYIILISKWVSLNISDVQNKYYYFAKILHSKKSDYGFRNVADSTPFSTKMQKISVHTTSGASMYW